ncbi:MAG: lytic transglycosylase domain-containing protein [Candidatus Binatia bacterium]
MELRKVGIQALASIFLSLPGHASAGLLEEFSTTRAFAYETFTILKKKSEPQVGRKEQIASLPSVDARRRKKLSRSEVDRLIQQKAQRYGINPDFIRAVVRVESAFNVDALSPKGAIGLMQLMPDTAKDLGVKPWDPKQNLEGGIRYMASLLWEFGDTRKALIAYNAGPEVVRKKVELPYETRRYVQSVLSYFKRSMVKQKERMLEDPYRIMLRM